MARVDLIRSLYRKQVPISEFKFDNLCSYPLLSYIHPQAIFQLNKIARSIKYQSKPKEKIKLFDAILKPYLFKRIAAGTNRVVYKHLNDQSIVLKVALDKVGLNDNPSEYRNQRFLKPFVTKCFEISPCGTVGIFERVQPITSRYEFKTISDDVFALLNKMIGKYILEDIGTKYFMNYGLRENFGPVLLDYPYMFELDGRKIHCNNPDPFTGVPCNGEIDYDDGFNNLICTKCGKVYLATELQKDMDQNNVVIDPVQYEKGEIIRMKVGIVKRKYDERGNVVGEVYRKEMDDGIKETSHILSKESYDDAMKVKLIKTTKTRKINNTMIRTRRKYKIEEPKIKVELGSHVQSSTMEIKIPEEPDQAIQRNRMKNDPVRADVFSTKNKRPDRRDVKKKEENKPQAEEGIDTEYIMNELMRKNESMPVEDAESEQEYEQKALEDF